MTEFSPLPVGEGMTRPGALLAAQRATATGAVLMLEQRRFIRRLVIDVNEAIEPVLRERRFIRQERTHASVARSSFAVATICCSAATVSGQARVFKPQSGLTHSRSAGTTFSARCSISFISSRGGTRGEWMS